MSDEPVVKEEWAQFIMGQALAEIGTEADIPRVIGKVESTAVGVRKDLMKTFRGLVESKRKILKKMGLKGTPQKTLCPRERRRKLFYRKEDCAAYNLGICDGAPEKINKQTCMHPEEAA